MTFDMSGNEYETLSFKTDEKDHGVVFDEIPIDKEYYLIVRFIGWSQVSLLE